MKSFNNRITLSNGSRLGRHAFGLLVATCSMLATASLAQAQPIVLDNNVPIIFKNISGADDGTQIRRFGGNALRFRYAGNVAIFDALENHAFQIRGAAGPPVFSVDPDSHAFFLNSGNLGVGRSPANNVKLDLVTNNGIGTGIRYLRTDARDARIMVGDPTRAWSMAVGWASPGDFSIIEELVSGNRLYIKQGGNVGLGTSNPQARLDVQGDARVNGTITTREVRVTALGWPDYVFDEAYSLPTLASVEAALARDGHLPGIPSAAEAEADGVEVGAMQAKLLEKVEELTLYMIELEKKNARLEARLADVEASTRAGS